MAVPRNRMSNARKNSKRAHHAKIPKQLSICINCKAPHLTHFSCPECGAYGDHVAAKAEKQA
jgi:large subunit ribosomal protein L32